MKFFKLPLLVQLDAYKQLFPSEFFMLSLCSKRMIIVLKAVKYRNSRLVVEPRKDERMSFHQTNWFFSIKTSREELDAICLTVGYHRPTWSLNADVWKLDFKPYCAVMCTPLKQVNAHHREEYMKLLKNVLCASPEKLSRFHIYRFVGNRVRGYFEDNNVQVTRNIQKYMCDLFSLPSNIVINTYIQSDHRFYENIIPNSIHTSVFHDVPHKELMDECYNSHPNQVLSIHQFAEINAIDIHKSHRIHQVENLVIRNVHVSLKWYMLHFRGRNALFERADMHEFFINAFLKQWKQSTNNNLETFIAYQEQEKVIGNVESITDGLELWDTEKHRKVYPYNSIIAEHHNFPEGKFDCEGGYFIQRETDGKIATLKLTPNYLMFFVWKQ